MAETYRLNVSINTEAERAALKQAFGNLQQRGIAQVRQPSLKNMIGNLAEQTISAPFAMAGRAVGEAGGSLISFVGPLARLSVTIGAGATGFLGLAAVITYVAIPLFNLAVTMKLMRMSFGWAQDQAEAQLRVIARTKRTFPGVIGEAFDRAEQKTRTSLNIGAALFGDMAEAMATGVTRRMSEAAMGRGMRGERNLFRDLGITPQAVQAYEEVRGQRMDLTEWLYLFVKKRDELDAQQQASAGNAAMQGRVTRQRQVLIDSSLKIFGQRFADIVGSFTLKDLSLLRDNMRRAAPLAEVTNADQNARDFTVALATLRNTFDELKKGIAGDVMPSLTQTMDMVRDWLTSTGSDGEMMGLKLRNVVSAIAIHGWETLEELVRSVDPDDVRAFIEPIKNWNPAEAISTIEAGASALVTLAEHIVALTEWVAWFTGRMKALRTESLRGEVEPLEPSENTWARMRRAWQRGGVRGFLGAAVGRPSAAIGGRGGAYRGAVGGGAYAPTFRGARGTPMGAPVAMGPAADTGGAIPQGVLSQAASASLSGGAAGVDRLLRKYGYSRNQAWCGMFAASVVRENGLTPPKNPQVAASWRTWGQAVEGAPRAGDVAVVRGISPRTGQEGRHVAFVENYNPKTGMVTLVGGNQGAIGNRSTYALSKLFIRRVPTEVAGMPQGAAEAQAVGQPTADQLAPSTVAAGGRLTTGPRGTVNKADLRRRAEEIVSTSGLSGYVPPDGGKYGIRTGAPHEWANYFVALAGKESSYNPSTSNMTAQERAISAGAGSHGLFQISPQDARLYNIKGSNFSMAELRDPETNLQATVKMHERLAKRAGFSRQGVGKYWGPVRRGELQVPPSPGPTAAPIQVALQTPPPTPAAEAARYAPPPAAAPAANLLRQNLAASEEAQDRERKVVTDLLAKRGAEGVAERKAKEAAEAREAITKPASRNVVEEGTAAGTAAARAFKEGIKDTKIPIKSVNDEAKKREESRDDREQEAA